MKSNFSKNIIFKRIEHTRREINSSHLNNRPAEDDISNILKLIETTDLDHCTHF